MPNITTLPLPLSPPLSIEFPSAIMHITSIKEIPAAQLAISYSFMDIYALTVLLLLISAGYAS
jgi:hypothetical protein